MRTSKSVKDIANQLRKLTTIASSNGQSSRVERLQEIADRYVDNAADSNVMNRMRNNGATTEELMNKKIPRSTYMGVKLKTTAQKKHNARYRDIRSSLGLTSG